MDGSGWLLYAVLPPRWIYAHHNFRLPITFPSPCRRPFFFSFAPLPSSSIYLMLFRFAVFCRSAQSTRNALFKQSYSALYTSAVGRRSAAAISQSAARSNLNVIDFFDPSLGSTPQYYKFQHGASGFPKSGKESMTTPQEDAIYTSVQVGDDAYFQRYDALGVADGVGGWRSHTGMYTNTHTHEQCFV